MSIEWLDEAQAVVGMKGSEDFISHTPMTHEGLTTRRNSKQRNNPKKDPLLGHRSHSTTKLPTWCPTRSAHDRKLLRVRKTVQNRRIDLLATDSDQQNRRRRHTSGDVSPRQCCHCSSILVSPRNDVGVVTAEHTGY